MSNTTPNFRQALRSVERKDGEQENHGSGAILIALRTKAELYASLETISAYVVEIPAKSASLVLQYVEPQLPYCYD